LGEALAGYTSGSAWAAREDAIKGTLEPGMVADVVVLDRDLFKTAPSEIVSTSVETTILGGQIVYDKNSETSR
jgi:predicted amidohydrolase YtcJ